MYYVLLARYLHYNIMLDKLNVKNRRIHQITVGHTLINQMSVGYTQGLALIPCLFAMVMDRMTNEIREEAPWTMMFAFDMVICCESKEHVEEKLESWIQIVFGEKRDESQ